MELLKNKFIGLLIITLFLVGCASEKISSAAEYLEFFDSADQGLMEEKTLGDISFSLLYKPLAYMAMKENKQLMSDKEKLKEVIHDFEGFQYFTFRIKMNAPSSGKDVLTYNSKGESDYNERVQYFAFSIQKDIKMVCGNDTLPCSLFHFERNYGLTDFTNFMVSFPETKDINSDRTFIYEDKYLGTGTVKLTVKASDINQLPNFN